MLSVVWFKLFQFVFKGHIIPSKREERGVYKNKTLLLLLLF